MDCDAKWAWVEALNVYSRLDMVEATICTKLRTRESSLLYNTTTNYGWLATRVKTELSDWHIHNTIWAPLYARTLC